MKRFLFFISFVFLSCASKQDVSLMNQKEIPLSSDNATSSEPYGYKDNKGGYGNVNEVNKYKNG